MFPNLAASVVKPLNLQNKTARPAAVNFQRQLAVPNLRTQAITLRFGNLSSRM